MNNNNYMPMAYLISRDLDWHFSGFALQNDYIPVIDMSAASDELSITEWHLRERLNNVKTAKMALMGKCDEVWIVTNRPEVPLSPVDQDVIDRAKLRHKKIRYFKYIPEDQDRLYFEEVGGFEG